MLEAGSNHCYVVDPPEGSLVAKVLEGPQQNMISSRTDSYGTEPSVWLQRVLKFLGDGKE